MRRTVTLGGIGAFGVCVFVLGLAFAGRGSSPGSSQPVSVVAEVRAELAASYYRPVPPEVLRLGNVPAMIAALNDPYTEYLDPSAYRLLREETAKTYFGIGVTLLPAPGGALVTATAPGPARDAGIRRGDTLVAVDGIRVLSVPFERVLARIVGPKGTVVTVAVRHHGAVRSYSLVRRRVSAPVVRSRVLSVAGRTVGYVQLSGFRFGAAQLLQVQLQKLERRGVSLLVLDLRENPGGLLDQAVSVVSLFVPRGVVCSVESAHHREVVSAAGREPVTRLPLAVLVDRYSASAAEVVAAALKDHRRALVVGESTFGKALVQTVTPLANGAALKLTTARYLTPSGEDINTRGVRPDVLAIDDPSTNADEALAAAVTALS